MSPIHSVLSDIELEEEFLDCLKKRNIDQKFAYVDDGAYLHYTSVTTNKNSFDSGVFSQGLKKFYDPTNEKQEEQQEERNKFAAYTDFGMKQKFWKYGPISFISLGCGNGEKEKELLRRLEEKKIDISYYGVDTSKTILELAIKKMEEVSLSKKFICADFHKKSFRNEIEKTIKSKKINIFAFLGGTFGSTSQTCLTENMFGMMKENDVLRVDFRVLSSIGERNIENVYNKFLSYLEIKNSVKSFLYALTKAGLEEGESKLKIAFAEEPQCGALEYKFYAQIEKKKKIEYSGEVITFLPGEKIPLLDIRVYKKEQFLHFMQEHGFTLLDFCGEEGDDVYYNAQFLFKKQDISE